MHQYSRTRFDAVFLRLLIPKPLLKSRSVRYKFPLHPLNGSCTCTPFVSMVICVCVYALSVEFRVHMRLQLYSSTAMHACIYNGESVHNNPIAKQLSKRQRVYCFAHMFTLLALQRAPHLEAIPELINDEVKIIYLVCFFLFLNIRSANVVRFILLGFLHFYVFLPNGLLGFLCASKQNE